MRLSSTIVGLVGAVAGSAVALTGYQHIASVDDLAPSSLSKAPAVPAVGRPVQAPPPRIQVRMAPCVRPAHLVRGTCLTEVTHTRVVYDPAPAPVPVPVAPAPVPGPVAAPVRVVQAVAAPRRAVVPRTEPRDHESDDHSETEVDDD